MTDKSYAEFVLACTHPIDVCADCFYADGPHIPALALISSYHGSSATKLLKITWEESYLGPVSFGIEAKRVLGECDINLKDPDAVADIYPGCPKDILSAIARISDVNFEVVPYGHVQVKPMGYNIQRMCGKDICALSDGSNLKERSW